VRKLAYVAFTIVFCLAIATMIQSSHASEQSIPFVGMYMTYGANVQGIFRGTPFTIDGKFTVKCTELSAKNEMKTTISGEASVLGKVYSGSGRMRIDVLTRETYAYYDGEWIDVGAAPLWIGENHAIGDGVSIFNLTETLSTTITKEITGLYLDCWVIKESLDRVIPYYGVDYRIVGSITAYYEKLTGILVGIEGKVKVFSNAEEEETLILDSSAEVLLSDTNVTFSRTAHLATIGINIGLPTVTFTSVFAAIIAFLRPKFA